MNFLGFTIGKSRVVLDRFDYDNLRHISLVVDSVMKNHETRLPFLKLAKQARHDLAIVEFEAQFR